MDEARPGDVRERLTDHALDPQPLPLASQSAVGEWAEQKNPEVLAALERWPQVRRLFVRPVNGAADESYLLPSIPIVSRTT